MKVRNGFVSNSSSSSFIVAFKKKPKTIEEIQDMFGTWSAEAAQRILNDMNKPATRKKIKELFISLESHGDFNNFKTQSGEIDWKAYEKHQEIEGTKKANDFLKRHKNKKIYTFNYGDENGQFESYLEHDVFWRGDIEWKGKEMTIVTINGH